MNQPHLSLQRLTDYREGRLDTESESDIELHLADCQHCCEQLDKMPDSIVDLFSDSSASNESDEYLILSGDADDKCEDRSWADMADARLQQSEIATEGYVEETATPSPRNSELVAALVNHPRYRVLGLLGQGGMGDVYKAEHRLMQRTVALKLIRQDLVRNSQAVERFRREVQAAARLDHPNVVTAHDAEQVGDWHFLVMEYVDGVTLAEEVAQRGPLPIREACEYIRQTALGLEHAHEQGMVHRDIKPHNLMLDSGKVKILDFGLASLVAMPLDPPQSDDNVQAESKLTRSGSMMGTPDYVAPEQAHDARKADIRADIYSLGCTLSFLVNGRAPAGKPIVQSSGNGVTEPELHELNELNEVMRRMLAERPQDRFQTPAEVAEALLPLTRAMPLPTQAMPQIESDKPSPRLDQESKQIPASQVDWSARYGLVCLTVAGVACFGLLALLGYFIVDASNYGKVIVESEVDDVQVVIRQGGEVVEVIDLKTGSQARLASGDYQVELKGDANHVELDRNKLSLSRFGKEIVRIRLVERVAEASKPQTPNLAADDPDIIAKPVPPESPILNRWVGRWNTDFIYETTKPSPRGARVAGVMNCIWTLEGQYLRAYWAAHDGGEQRLSLMRVVPNATPTVHCWSFCSNGSFYEQRGVWMEDKATLTLKPVSAAAKESSEMVYRFTSADCLEMLNPAPGPSWFGSRSESVRRPEPPYPAPSFADGPADAPAQLKFLSPLADRKTVEVTWRESQRHAGFLREAKVEDAKWVLQGRFLFTRTLDAQRRVEELCLLTYVPTENSFRCWVFRTDGLTGQWRFAWDPASQRFLWKTIDGAQPFSGAGEVRVIDRNTLEADSRLEDAQGRAIAISNVRKIVRPARASLNGENLTNDPSLEETNLGVQYPRGWGKFNADPKDGYRSELVEGGRTGKRGWLIEGEGMYITVPANRVPIDRGKGYVGRGWVKQSGGGSAEVRLLYFDKSLNYIGETRGNRVLAGKQWQPLTVTDRLAEIPNAHYIALAMSVVGQGRAVFDDLELRTIEPN